MSNINLKIAEIVFLNDLVRKREFFLNGRMLKCRFHLKPMSWLTSAAGFPPEIGNLSMYAVLNTELLPWSVVMTQTMQHLCFQQRLFAFWSACCIAAIAIVYVNSQRIKWSVAAAKRKSDTTPTNDRSGEHKPAQKTDDRPGEQEPAKNTDRPGEHDPAQNTDNRPGEHDPAQNTDDNVAQQRNVSILARKQFHVLMLCVFLPGLIFHTEMLTLASSCALGVFIIAEVSDLKLGVVVYYS